MGVMKPKIIRPIKMEEVRPIIATNTANIDINDLKEDSLSKINVIEVMNLLYCECNG